MTYQPLTLRRLDADETGEEIPLDENGTMADLVIQEADLTRQQLRDSIVATDMDNTMFKDVPEQNITGDLGILVFVEKLADPTFWQFTKSHFKRLLLPDIYRQCAEDHLPGGTGNMGIDPMLCRRLLDMLEDITELYSIQRKLVIRARSERKNEHDISVEINTPVVNEFALKMIEFDYLVKGVENPLMNIGRARILMRTRFFTGKNIEVAKLLMRGVMDRSRIPSEERKNGHHLHLEMQTDIHTAISDITNGNGYAQRIKDVDSRRINRIVAINEDVRRMIARLAVENGAFAVVITANLRALADEAVEGSDYRCIVDKVMGSRLRFKIGTEDVFQSKFEGAALHGEHKVDALTKVQEKTGKTVRFALGDSILGDGPMGIEAVRNGGIFIVTGQNFETIQRQFAKLPEQARVKGVNNMAQRTWVLSY